MKRIGVAISVIFLLAVNCYAAEIKTFNGSGQYFNYSVDYPSDWQAGNIYGFVQIIAPLENNSDDFKENVVISVADLSKKPKTLEEFNTLMLDKIIPQELSNFQLLDKGKTTIDGKDGLFYVYKGTKEGRGLKYKRYTFASGSCIYELTFEARAGDFDKYLPEADSIVASIKVK